MRRERYEESPQSRTIELPPYTVNVAEDELPDKAPKAHIRSSCAYPDDNADFQ